jgi:hypothetical protein
MATAMAVFTEDLGFTVAFLIGALLISITLGEKPLYGYLILVLLSMMVMNSAKLGVMIRKVTK